MPTVDANRPKMKLPASFFCVQIIGALITLGAFLALRQNALLHDIVDEIRSAWGWTGLDPIEIVGENDFGNLIVRDAQSCYWRICPEECSCEVVAKSPAELDALSRDQEFLHNWYMRAVVEIARRQCGALSAGQKYCLKIPSVLGGKYETENLAAVPLAELIRSSGHIASEVNGLSDGTRIRLKVVE